MNVYFIPLGRGRFEPYFEHVHEDVQEAAESSGFISRMYARFREVLQEAERHRHERAHEPPAGIVGRFKQTFFRWLAERVAEQRLLWNLRTIDHATLHVPDTLDPAVGEREFRQILQRDGDSHLRKLALHSLGLILSAPFALIPGPNIFGYFFVFTVVGHFLAYRGARRGNSVVTWTVTPSAALTELGRALTAAPQERYQLVHDVADRLHLPRLALFVERMAVPTA